MKAPFFERNTGNNIDKPGAIQYTSLEGLQLSLLMFFGPILLMIFLVWSSVISSIYGILYFIGTV